MKCPKCNYENKENTLYCGLCYEVLRKEKQNPETVSQPEPINLQTSKPKTSDKTKLILISISLFLIIIVAWLIIREMVMPIYAQKRRIEETALAQKKIRDNFKPYTGQIDIQINLISQLFGMTKQTLHEFRKSKIDEHAILNIFQPAYVLCSKIFDTIEYDKDWVNSAQFYICNPYQLIILSNVNSITALIDYCKNPEIKYSNRTIEETYRGNDAEWLFKQIYSTEAEPGKIRLWMVNAYDAGLKYANIDKQKSENIDFAYNTSSEDIVNSAYSQPCLFHVGRYNKNNLSPADINGRLKISERDKYTCIYVKLWLLKPQDIAQQEDFAYIIKIIP